MGRCYATLKPVVANFKMACYRVRRRARVSKTDFHKGHFLSVISYQWAGGPLILRGYAEG